MQVRITNDNFRCTAKGFAADPGVTWADLTDTWASYTDPWSIWEVGTSAEAMRVIVSSSDSQLIKIV
jgi:hypothetical protein